MNWKTEKRNKHPKHLRTISIVMAVAIALGLFAGIVLAEGGNMGINDVNAIQNTTGIMTDTRESCIANTSFEITIPHSKEKLKIVECRDKFILASW